MAFLRALGKVLFSRAMLGGLLLVGLGLGLWFGGPYLGVGESRPLADSGVRIMLLVLMLAFVLFWLLHWPVSVVGAAALCLLIWYGSPLLVVGDARPFAPELVRLGIVGTIGLIFAVYIGYRLWVAFKADKALLRRMLHPTGSDSPAREQIAELQHGMKKALGHLRTLTSEISGIRRLFQHSRYIYELPWYMIFGAPGTGKTTLVLNSGLRFPLAEQAGSVTTAGIAGIKGTRNCMWWFTNEAVLIDTAGRYTTHETNQVVDAAEWRGFLGLLRRYRPRAPLNGALLAVSVEELAGASAAELNATASNLRERLAELQHELGVSFPVYILITKMDLITGFRAYFQNLGAEGRQQVLGFTLPHGRGTRQALAHIRQTCEGEFQLLRGRLEQGLNVRLHEEFSPERRRELYCLPGDFAELSAPLMRLIEGIFFESRYNAANIRHSLRGVYFTSAVQEDASLPPHGGSLLQRLSTAVSTAVRNGGAAVGRHLATEPRTLVDTRGYFLENTLRKVIFPEAFLVRRNTRWELRFMLVRGLGHLTLLVAALGVAFALMRSADNNTRLLTEITARTDILAENLRIVQQDRSESGIAHVLEQACNLTTFAEPDTASPPFAYRAGLYAAGESRLASEQLCVTLRERFLLPRFTVVLHEQLASALQQSAGRTDTDRHLALYEALELYSMFYDPAHFDAGILMDRLGEILSRRGGKESGGGVFRDNAALTAALEDTLRRTAHFVRPTAMDQKLVAEARKQLQALSREERLYLLVRQALNREAPEDFVPARFAGEDGALYRVGGRGLADSIPGLFTYAGYHEVFLPRLDDLLPDALATDTRIMDEATSSANRNFVGNQAEITRLNREVRRLYYRDYVRQWSGLVEGVRAGTGASPEQDLILLTRLGSADSPLERLAQAVVRETALSAKEATVGDQLAAVAEKKLRAKTRTTALNFSSVDEAAMVDNRFENLRKVVTGSAAPNAVLAAELKSSAEMEAIRLLLTEFALYTRDLQKAAAARTMPPVSDITDRLRNKALQLPPFFSTVLMDLADRGARREGESKGGTLGTLLGQVADPCTRMVSSRYPFVPAGRDADPVEFTRVFGPGGSLDVYFSTHLAPLVDTAQKPWTYLRDLPGAPDLAPFETVSMLREALWPSGDKQWRIPLRVSVVDMDSRIERLELTISDKVLRYAHGPDQAMEVSWESGGKKPVAGMVFWPRNAGLKPLNESGPWALFRLLDRGKVVNRISAEEFWVEYDLNGHSLTLSITTEGATPLGTDMLEGLVCPGQPLVDPIAASKPAPKVSGTAPPVQDVTGGAP